MTAGLCIRPRNGWSAPARRLRVWLVRHLCPDGYCPIAETHPRADHRSPLEGAYDPVTIRRQVLGRESATCEACGATVRVAGDGDLADGVPFVIRDLVPNVCTVENTVLLCVDCAARPAADWRADVRASRAEARPAPPRLRALLGYWLLDPTARSLFARRVVALAAVVGGCLLALVCVAGGIGWLLGGPTLGIEWASAVVDAAVAGGYWLGRHGWLAAGLVGVGYVAHAIERVRNDPRGYRPGRWRPWPLVGVGGLAVAGAVALQAVHGGVLPTAAVVTAAIVTLWTSGATVIAWQIDRAVRHDLLVTHWRPARLKWVVAGRIGLLPGVLLLGGVPPPAWLAPAVTGSGRLVLLALPAGVALGFGARRLPYAPRARAAVLGLLPARLRAWLDDD